MSDFEALEGIVGYLEQAHLKTVQQLSDATKLLEELALRFAKLERDVTRLQLEVMRHGVMR